MSLETPTWIDDLVVTNPVAADPRSQGDDHIRNLKTVLKTTFPRAGKSFRFPTILAKTANYTVLNTDDNTVFVCAGASGNMTLTLPNTLTTAEAGWAITVYCNHATNDVIVAPPSGDISGDATIVLDLQYSCVTIVWTGTVFIYLRDQFTRKLQTVTGDRLLGRTGANGPVEEISLGTGLQFNANTIEVTTTVPMSPPQGRLTATSTLPRAVTNVTAGTSIFYTPYVGDKVPLYSGSAWALFTFVQMTLTLNATAHVADTNYDIFIAENPDTPGSLILGTGPAWATNTEGSGARGTGAGTTELEMQNGFQTNKNPIVLKNGSTTYTSVAVNRALYLGTFRTTVAAGQVACYGGAAGNAKARWGIWNNYNRLRTTLRMFDNTASWTYALTTIRQSRAAATNSLQVVQGLAENEVSVEFRQNHLAAENIDEAPEIGIGKNSITVFATAFRSKFGANLGQYMSQLALLNEVPFIGSNSYNSLERCKAALSHTFYGTEAEFLLKAEFFA